MDEVFKYFIYLSFLLSLFIIPYSNASNGYNIKNNYTIIGNQTILFANGHKVKIPPIYTIVSNSIKPEYIKNLSTNFTGNSFVNFQYAGYYAISNKVTRISGSWIVSNTTPTNSFTDSLQWIGIGGMDTISGNLIQVGTCTISDYFAYGKNVIPFVWYEEAPGESAVIIPYYDLYVKVGDRINATIYLVNAITNTWNITIFDSNAPSPANNFICLISSFNVTPLTGEFVLEPACLSNCKTQNPEISALPSFSMDYQGSDFSGFSGGDGLTLENQSLILEKTKPDPMVLLSSNGSILATPDPITPDGTSFGITYGALRVSNITSTALREGKSNKVVLRATVLGSTSPSNLTYKWYIVNITNFARTFIRNTYTNNTVTITQAKPNVTYAVFVSDNGLTPNPIAYNYTTASPLITVNPNNLTAPTIFPQTPKLDNSQSVTLNATENLTPTSGNLIWQWYIVSNSNALSQISNTNSSTITVSPSSNTAYEVSVTATTGNGKLHYSIPDNVVVAPTPTISMIPSSTSITLSQSINFTATIPPNVGFGPFVTDLILSANIVSIKTIPSNGGNVIFTYTPNAIGNYTFSVLSIDSGTYLPFSFTSQSNTITVKQSHPSVISSIPVKITNNQGATAAPFQQILTVNSITFNGIDANWTNVEFSTVSDASGSILQAWVESGASNTSNNTIVWIKFPEGLPEGTTTIYMNIMSNSVMSSSGPTGEAPKLSPSYGEYDNGGNVFNFYDNFESINTTKFYSPWIGECVQNNPPSLPCIPINTENTITGKFYDGYREVVYPNTTQSYLDPIFSKVPIPMDNGKYVLEFYGTEYAPLTTFRFSNKGALFQGSGACGVDLPGYIPFYDYFASGSKAYFLNMTGSPPPAPNSSRIQVPLLYGTLYYQYTVSDSSATETIEPTSVGPVLSTATLPLSYPPSNLIPNTNTQCIYYTSTNGYLEFVRVRTYPPSGIMPTATFGQTVTPLTSMHLTTNLNVQNSTIGPISIASVNSVVIGPLLIERNQST
ncbi:MAG: DUF2341 domain-containing protein [Candidatus Marsarchaeota archaeon]|nr:DUF2341 domain-containing protein [Candidatus Marsarchaeota archaeon]